MHSKSTCSIHSLVVSLENSNAVRWKIMLQLSGHDMSYDTAPSVRRNDLRKIANANVSLPCFCWKPEKCNEYLQWNQILPQKLSAKGYATCRDDKLQQLCQNCEDDLTTLTVRNIGCFTRVCGTRQESCCNWELSEMPPSRLSGSDVFLCWDARQTWWNSKPPLRMRSLCVAVKDVLPNTLPNLNQEFNKIKGAR